MATRINRRLYLALLATAFGGCAEMPKNMPLIFGETITLGVSIGGTAADQGVDVTLGFKSRDLAIVPVTVEKKDGSVEKLTASIVDGKNRSVDAYSVLGQFSATTDGKAAKIGLGKFFATGNAAVQLSTGFRNSMTPPGVDDEEPATPPKPAPKPAPK